MEGTHLKGAALRADALNCEETRPSHRKREATPASLRGTGRAETLLSAERTAGRCESRGQAAAFSPSGTRPEPEYWTA